MSTVAEELRAALAETNRPEGAWASVVRAVKPNLIFVVSALVGVCAMVVWMMDGSVDTVKEIAVAETATARLEALVGFLTHLLSGTLLLPVIVGLTTLGVKLLDDPAKPGVPIEVALKLIEAKASGDEAKLQALEDAAP